MTAAAAAGEGIIAMRTMNKDKEEMINVVKVCIIFLDFCLYYVIRCHINIVFDMDFLAVCQKHWPVHYNCFNNWLVRNLFQCKFGEICCQQCCAVLSGK